MFTSTLELITLAASNSHILFCFCNLIIAILLIGTKPVFSNFHRQVTVPPPVMGNEGSHNVVDYNEKGITINGAPATQSVTVDGSTHEDHETANVDRDEKQNVTTHNEEEEEEEVDEGEDDRDGDELRRRVEEFIDKINKAWKAEKLGHIPIYST